MLAIFGTQKKEKVRSLENKVHLLVNRKEQRLQTMDEDGREIVLALSEQLGSYNERRKNLRNIISKAERYWRENRHYY